MDQISVEDVLAMVERWSRRYRGQRAGGAT
jgi:hypothetical protein